MDTKQPAVLTLSAMAEWVAGTVLGADVAIVGATQDSRKIGPGQLFVALPGTQVDGHDYVAKAAGAGAAAALVSRKVDVEIPQLLVADVELALQQAAAAWRRSLAVKVIAITGSCGKTSVKQMLAAILSQQAETLATAGNLNNQLGVPLTLLGLTASHRFAVIEMGASKAGDIALLCDIAAPDVALITMVAEAHLEGFGSLQGIAEAKGEIYAGLGDTGIAIMNDGERWNLLWHQQSNAPLALSFGSNALADVSVSKQHCEAWLGDAQAGSRFQLNLPQGTVAINLPLPGWHNVMNAAAAAAAAVAVDVASDKIVAGLETAENVAGRLGMTKLANGSTLVDDSYNANPASIKAAASWLLAAGVSGRCFLVLGEMAELGENSLAVHQQLGRELRDMGLEWLRTTGQAGSQALADGFGEAAAYHPDRELLVATLAAELQPDDVVLVKGSRSAAMDQLAAALSTVLASQGHGQTSEVSGA